MGSPSQPSAAKDSANIHMHDVNRRHQTVIYVKNQNKKMRKNKSELGCSLHSYIVLWLFFVFFLCPGTHDIHAREFATVYLSDVGAT